MATFAAPYPKELQLADVSTFLQDSLIKPRLIQNDSIPQIKRNGFILVPRSTKLYDVIFLVVPESELSVETVQVTTKISLYIF